MIESYLVVLTVFLFVGALLEEHLLGVIIFLSLITSLFLVMSTCLNNRGPLEAFFLLGIDFVLMYFGYVLSIKKFEKKGHSNLEVQK